MAKRNWNEEIGKRYGNLTVTGVFKSEKDNRKKFLCKCDCGNIASFDVQNVTHGKSRSCGCLRAEASSKRFKKRNWDEEIGKKYNHLLILSVLDSETDSHKNFLCKCDCGKVITALSQNVIRGKSASCGCVRNQLSSERGKARATHNGSNTPLYKLWESMRRRCGDSKSKDYKWYGGKGISVCEAWGDFGAFRDWAYANRYVHGLTIDRISSSENYCPENCRWIPLSENSRLAHQQQVTVNGRTLNKSQWAKEIGVSKTSLCKWFNLKGEPYAIGRIESALSGGV